MVVPIVAGILLIGLLILYWKMRDEIFEPYKHWEFWGLIITISVIGALVKNC